MVRAFIRRALKQKRIAAAKSIDVAVVGRILSERVRVAAAKTPRRFRSVRRQRTVAGYLNGVCCPDCPALRNTAPRRDRVSVLFSQQPSL